MARCASPRDVGIGQTASRTLDGLRPLPASERKGLVKDEGARLRVHGISTGDWGVRSTSCVGARPPGLSADIERNVSASERASSRSAPTSRDHELKTVGGSWEGPRPPTAVEWAVCAESPAGESSPPTLGYDAAKSLRVPGFSSNLGGYRTAGTNTHKTWLLWTSPGENLGKPHGHLPDNRPATSRWSTPAEAEGFTS